MLWRHYPDKTALDAQFTLDTIADLTAVMQRRLDLSARARATLPHRLKIPYGAGPDATLDLFLPPEAARPAPVLMFIHGGFWKALDAATFSFVGGFAPLGALVAVIDYPLIPSVRMDGIVDHVGQALAWLARHAGEHGGDPARLHVAGHSAGGHLTAVALDRGWQEEHGIPAGAVRGGVALSGVFELEPLRRSFQQETLGFTQEEAERWSPLRRVPERAGPLVVAVGGGETQEFIDQSLEFTDAWRAAGHAAELHVVARANHIDILTDAFAQPGAPLHSAVLRQMGLAG
ncbi:alpha/beta hydrolase [Alsobacter sp. SYSU M60028]|uniref:Alpha/beta hydrolase n=1 Tax=Alsobacter ponti TaxID=2962936 RepID=A0ABT1LAU8_9HYPH|nr:alpha/beta hydrolase [Alsobacter ponti]MCP8937895.1 alpha/beta hydrolase [Alsobacter ponti]